jgi:uncharacterized membrane protein (DUF106 family)
MTFKIKDLRRYKIQNYYTTTKKYSVTTPDLKKYRITAQELKKYRVNTQELKNPKHLFEQIKEEQEATPYFCKE